MKKFGFLKSNSISNYFLPVIFFIGCCSLPIENCNAQSMTNVKFGKNRVQYHNFTWQYFTSDNFITYFSLGGQEIGRYTAENAEKVLPEIEKILEYRLEDPVEILVYNDVSDVKQSNIGFDTELTNTGGVTHVVENKIFVFFNGDHTDLDRQIREGIAEVLINNMMFGGNVQEVLQNAVLLNLPVWFTDGIIAYSGVTWSADLDNELRTAILSGKFKKFNRLSGEEARLAGHAVWWYVSQTYGEEAVPNLLYLTRINRSIESGFLFVLGASTSKVISEWYKYNEDRFSREALDKPDPEENTVVYRTKKSKAKYLHDQVKISADGSHIAFATNLLGQVRVYVMDTKTKKLKKILKESFKTVEQANDTEYPILAWDPTGRKLAVVYELRDQIKLMFYNTEDGKKEITNIEKFQRVHSIGYTDDPRMMVMSASNKGQSDIYTYYLPTTRTDQITNDRYDDRNPSYVQIGNQKGILFSSNRPDDTLRTERADTFAYNPNFDIFYCNLAQRSDVLLRVTNTRFTNEDYPLQYNNYRFSYLSDQNGIYNRFLSYFDSTFSHFDTLYYYTRNNGSKDRFLKQPRIKFGIDSVLKKENATLDSSNSIRVYKSIAIYYPFTNYSTSILEQDVALKSHQSAELFLDLKGYAIHISPIDTGKIDEISPFLINTAYRSSIEYSWEQEQIKNQQIKEEIIIPEDDTENIQIDTVKKIQETFYFQSEFDDELPPVKNDSLQNSNPIQNISINQKQDEEDGIFKWNKVLPYRVKFTMSEVTSQLDNNMVFDRYENFVTNGGVFSNPDLGGLMSINLSDLFDDYIITGGVKFPFDFNGISYFLSLDSRRKRLDKKLILVRDVIEKDYLLQVGPFLTQVKGSQKTHLANYSLTYAIDHLRSVRAHFGYRNDGITFLSQENVSLEADNYYENWFQTKWEYVFDNTLPVATNIRFGSRYKIWVELHKQVLFKNDPFNQVVNDKFINLETGYLGVLSGDFRHYQKVQRNIIWASRFAFGTSFGSRKLIYYLGGVDNWYTGPGPERKFDQSTPINYDAGYAFQTVATNLRGFRQNVRNGNNYALINTELRIPIFSYLVNSPIRSEFIKNFQLIGFGDVGTAWEGFSPYDESNPFNTAIFGTPPVVVEVNYFRNPVVGGFGFGLRTTLFGYFMRLDHAWGVDSGEILDPKWYFSMGLDF